MLVIDGIVRSVLFVVFLFFVFVVLAIEVARIAGSQKRTVSIQTGEQLTNRLFAMS